MRKAIPLLLPLLFAAVLCGCGLFDLNVEVPDDSTAEYSYVYTPDSSVTAPVPGSESESGTLPEETTVLPPETTSAPAQTTTSVVTVPTVPLPEQPPATTAAPEPTTSFTVPTDNNGDVDLSIVLPDANGTMEVSTDPSNPFILAVHRSRGIDTSLLAAVYAVPESGQNYVFEFLSGSERTAESLRRVYLLTAEGEITSVAASDNAERENLTTVENWFCMNVLIKNMVFPAVSDRM